jgi:hypothetical protein
LSGPVSAALADRKAPSSDEGVSDLKVRKIYEDLRRFAKTCEDLNDRRLVAYRRLIAFAELHTLRDLSATQVAQFMRRCRYCSRCRLLGTRSIYWDGGSREEEHRHQRAPCYWETSMRAVTVSGTVTNGRKGIRRT